VRVWTAHLRGDAAPVLLRDGFAWGAVLFGPLWLAANRAWVPAALSLAGYLLIGALTAPPATAVLAGCLAWLHGLSGHDLRRWALSRRGFEEGHVVVARSELDALARLLAARPDLLARYAVQPA
jgi:hypothetical protein